MSNDKICFAGSGTPFIEQDKKLLGSLGYDVDQHSYKGNLLSYFLSYRHEIKRAVKDADIVFGWFASWETMPAVYYAKRYDKKSIVVAGGYDTAYVPEIGYGAFTNIKERIPAWYIFKNADIILVVDLSLKKAIMENVGISGENIEYLPTGHDPSFFKPKGEKKDIILTVGNLTESVIKRKGLDVFVRAAKYIPQARFVLIGNYTEDCYLIDIASSNVEFTGFVPLMDDCSWYQKARVYCQLSRYEGLPTALCQAMLCECIPVGTRQCGIPTAIGETGFYVPYGDVEATVKGIQKALNAPHEHGKKSRERIMNLFSLEQRKIGLFNIIEKGSLER